MTTVRMLAFVFATSMEADPFIAMTHAERKINEPWPIYRARIAGQAVIIIITGMGMDSAKVGTEFIIKNYAANTIFNCGVAGSLTDEYSVGDIVNISHSLILQGRDNSGDVCSVSTHSHSLDGYSDGVLVTVDRPVFDQHRKKTLSAVAQLVDMEGGVVARHCLQNNIPCQLIKIISDYAAEQDQLKTNLHQVSEKLARRITADLTSKFSQERTA